MTFKSCYNFSKSNWTQPMTYTRVIKSSLNPTRNPRKLSSKVIFLIHISIGCVPQSIDVKTYQRPKIEITGEFVSNGAWNTIFRGHSFIHSKNKLCKKAIGLMKKNEETRFLSKGVSKKVPPDKPKHLVSFKWLFNKTKMKISRRRSWRLRIKKIVICRYNFLDLLEEKTLLYLGVNYRLNGNFEEVPL